MILGKKPRHKGHGSDNNTGAGRYGDSNRRNTLRGKRKYSPEEEYEDYNSGYSRSKDGYENYNSGYSRSKDGYENYNSEYNGSKYEYENYNSGYKGPKDDYEDYNSGYNGPIDDYDDEDYYYDDGSRDPLHQRRTWLIGRKSPCDIIYDDPSVSRIHCQVVKTKNSYYISDLHSSNGTYINGYQLIGETRLYEEDLVRIGGVTFTFTEDMF